MRNKSVGVGVANTSSIVRDVTKFIIVVIMMKNSIGDYIFSLGLIGLCIMSWMVIFLILFIIFGVISI